MKILLQQAGTGLYFKSLGKWTKNPSDALAFYDTIRAVDYTIYHRMKDAYVVPFPESTPEQFRALTPSFQNANAA
jgi:hypothetical protein